MAVKKAPKYLAFALGTDRELAKIRFKAKYGVDPERVFDGNNLLLLGPVPKENDNE